MCKRIFDESAVLKDNAMLKVRPELFYEWNFEKNDKLGFDIYKVTKSSAKIVWWLGECGHEWDTKITNRNNGHGCPYCSNQRILIGFNDMWTTNPELASLLADSEDGHKYTQWSGKRVDWKCPDCKWIIRDKLISIANSCRLACPKCSDGISYPEKFMISLFQQLNVKYEHDITIEWSNRKRYDFYLPEYSMIIETHGIQHYKESTRGRSLKEEHFNDTVKKSIALNNGIEKYVELDCSKSNFEYIKKSILNSELIHVFDLSKIDWIKVNLNACSSLVLEVCKLWDNGDNSTKKIARMLNIVHPTVVKYLKRGALSGICNYSKEKSIKIGRKQFYKIIIQLDANLNFIKEWESLTIACRELEHINIYSLIDCCKFRTTGTGGFKWMYLEDYERFLDGETMPDILYREYRNSRPVVKLNKNLELIDTYETITQSSICNNLKNRSGITSCCKGKQKTAGGFKWMYKDDYEKMINEKSLQSV